MGLCLVDNGQWQRGVVAVESWYLLLGKRPPGAVSQPMILHRTVSFFPMTGPPLWSWRPQRER